MSTTYDLCCPSRGLKLWVGQSDYIYSGPEYIQKLARFLHETKGEPLIFVSDHDDSDEIDACDYFEGLGVDTEQEQ